tara:strand:- start:2282 stop:3184 length:903 start_codon:yes stop_codon:yes gene_type:complete
MKILFCILTCNRYFYLKNCIDSILEFLPAKNIDLLICDNNTVDKRLRKYTTKIEGRFNSFYLQTFKDRHHAELYRAMNYGIEFARQRNIDVINFVQDDFQYIRKDNDILCKVGSFLSKNPKMVQLNTNMVWKYKKKKRGRMGYVSDGDENYAIMKDKFACDNGFTRMSVYNKIGLYPLNKIAFKAKDHNRIAGRKKYIEGESWFAHRCKRLKLFRAISMNPNAAMIFDCAYVRGDYIHGEYFAPKKQFYIKPLSNKLITNVESNNRRKKSTYIENLCEPWGYSVKTMGKHSLSKKKKKIK